MCMCLFELAHQIGYMHAWEIGATELSSARDPFNTYARSPRVLVAGCSPPTTSAVVSMPSRTKPTNKSVSAVMSFSVCKETENDSSAQRVRQGSIGGGVLQVDNFTAKR